MEKHKLEELDQKLRSLGLPDPDPTLRQRTLGATKGVLQRRSRDLTGHQATGWWLDGLLAAAVILLAVGGSLLQQIGWAPVDPRTLTQQASTEHYRQLQEHFDHVPLGFAASAPKTAQGSKAWGNARPHPLSF